MFRIKYQLSGVTEYWILKPSFATEESVWNISTRLVQLEYLRIEVHLISPQNFSVSNTYGCLVTCVSLTEQAICSPIKLEIKGLIKWTLIINSSNHETNKLLHLTTKNPSKPVLRFSMQNLPYSHLFFLSQVNASDWQWILLNLS